MTLNFKFRGEEGGMKICCSVGADQSCIPGPKVKLCQTVILCSQALLDHPSRAWRMFSFNGTFFLKPVCRHG